MEPKRRSRRCVVGRYRACPCPSTATRPRAGLVPAVALHLAVHDRGPCALPASVLTMLVCAYRKRVAATVIALAQEDPLLVKEVIARLRRSGEIATDDLVYLDRIADRWIGIAYTNRRRPATALAT